MTPANQQAEKRQALKDRFAHLRDKSADRREERARKLEAITTTDKNKDKDRGLGD